MGPRSRKLANAAVVLFAGLILAWPLRLKSPLPPVAPLPGGVPQGGAGQVMPAKLSFPPVGPHTLPAREVSTAAAGSINSTPAGGLVNPSAPQAAAEERLHVVHPGDSLERLAKRYLGDERRALEIFDLNRQVLENPHLLGIGVELRIPPSQKPSP